jgi:hypothetical protein
MANPASRYGNETVKGQQTYLNRSPAQPVTGKGTKIMQMLYDSDSFVVVHLQANEPLEGEVHPRSVRHGFEIVDKRSNKEVYLDGTWADAFQRQINAWQVNTPTQEEVEATLDGYAELAQNPLVIH